MNNPPIWCTEDAALLRQLRESAKTDSLVFARLNAISLAQLRELEGQGEGGFYNPQIKANTGIKLLKKLGHERVLVGTPAPPALPTVEARSSAVLVQAPQTTKTTTPATSAPAKVQGTSARRPALWVGGMLVLGGLVWLGTQLPKTPSPLDPRTQTAGASAKATAALSLGANNSSSKVAEAPSPPDAQAAPAEAPATPTPCDAQWRQASLNYEPTQPLKLGNYVYFSATQDASLCVRDHKNQLTQLELKAGTSRSVYGEPPFLVHSPKWSNLKVFFQGRQIGAKLEDSSHWMFKKSALPIPSPE